MASDKAIASGEAAKVVKAHETAMKFISEHPDEAIAIAVKHTGMDEKTVREAFSHVAYTAVPAVEQEKEYVNFLNAFKLINVPDEAAFTGQFIKSLVK